MPKLAFYTAGPLHEPRDHPRTKGFLDRVPFVFASAENSNGFVDRAPQRSTGKQDARWGDPRAEPRFVVNENDAAPATISLWEDLESVYAFAYYGRHMEAVSKGKEWFRKSEWPFYVAWWVEDDHIPAREEAVAKMEKLHDQGATPDAFDFKTPFDANGDPWRMERDKIKVRAEVVNKFDQDNPTGL